MIDQFIVFTLPLEQQMLVNRYSSPRNEASVFKFVPLDRVDEFKRLTKLLTGKTARVRYRGPRYHSEYNTIKRNATHASIYTVRV